MKNLLFMMLVSLCFFTSCKKDDSSVDPVQMGSITGTVMSSSTSIAGVQISTSPVTGSVLTDASGKYTINNVPAGQYVVTAAKTGYQNNSITVNVNSGKQSAADILLTSTQPPTNGLLAWWPLDEGAGTIANDFSGNGYNGTVSSGVTWLTGGLNLNGGNNSVNFSDLGFRLNEGSWQVIINAESGKKGWILCKDDYGFRDDGMLELGVDRKVYFTLHSSVSNTGYTITSTSIIPINTDVTITAEWGSQGMKLFINNNLEGTNSYKGPILSTGRPLSLGINQGDPASFTGIIKDVKVYTTYIK